jgi:hypothetical protein
VSWAAAALPIQHSPHTHSPRTPPQEVEALTQAEALLKKLGLKGSLFGAAGQPAELPSDEDLTAAALAVDAEDEQQQQQQEAGSSSGSSSGGAAQ